jgi:hypothetical protein
LKVENRCVDLMWVHVDTRDRKRPGERVVVDARQRQPVRQKLRTVGLKGGHSTMIRQG